MLLCRRSAQYCSVVQLTGLDQLVDVALLDPGAGGIGHEYTDGIGP